MSEGIEMTHARWKKVAVARGWKIPPDGSRLADPDWYEPWVRYWAAMDDYERQVARGNKDAGRPVAPHRSA